MAAALALDLLLLVALLLLVPLGAWRGGPREIVVSASILLGATLMGAWARPWGDDLATLADLRPQAARFLVAAALLLGAVAALGYPGGVLLGHHRPTLRERAAGAFLAACNGVLLLSFMLGALDRFLLEGAPRQAIERGIVGRGLLHGTGWVLVATATAAGIAVAAGLLGRRLLPGAAEDPSVPVPVGAGTPSGWGSAPDRRGEPDHVAPRARPVRVPRQADAGKIERPDRSAPPRGVPIARGTVPVTLSSDRSPGDEDRARPWRPDAGHRPPVAHGSEGWQTAWAQSIRRPEQPGGPTREGALTGDEPPARSSRPRDETGPQDEPREGGTVLDDWLRRAAAGTRPAEHPDASHRWGDGHPRHAPTDADVPHGEEPSSSGNGNDGPRERCRICGEALARVDRACPVCGTPNPRA